jgi:hypothetical protein
VAGFGAQYPHGHPDHPYSVAVDFVKHMADHAGVVIEKQNRFAALVGPNIWATDINGRQITFRDESGNVILRVGADLLFGEDTAQKVVQWAWDMSGDTPSEAVKARSRALRDWGQKHEFAELTMASWKTDPVRTGPSLACVAAGIGNYDAVFVAPDSDGITSYFAITSPLITIAAFDLTAMAKAICDLCNGYPVEHRRAILAYFAARGLSVTQPMGRVVGVTPTGAKIRVIFDELGRIQNLQGDFAVPEGLQLNR